LLVPVHDAPALAAAIVRLLTNHPLADMLAREGHDFVHANFSVEHMVAAVSAVYEDGVVAVAARRSRSYRCLNGVKSMSHA